MDKNSFLTGLKKGLPIGVGYLAVSFSFGVLAVKHITPLMATIISFTNVSSLGQLAGLNMIAETASLFEIAITVLLINLRYALMSISLSQKIDQKIPVWQRLIFGFYITDEIFATTITEKEKIKASYMFGIAIFPVIGWVGGTALGAFGSGLIGERLLNAFGIALYAMFVAILIPDCKKDKTILFVSVLSAAISCLFTYVPYIKEIGVGFKIVIATIISAVITSLLFPVKDEEEKKEEMKNV